MYWNKIIINEDKGSLDNFPNREDDVVFLVGKSFYTGYFINELDYQNPNNSDFGFIEEDGGNYFETGQTLGWVYAKDLIQEVEDE